MKMRVSAAALAAWAAMLLLPNTVFPGALPEGKPGPGEAAPPFVSKDLDGNRVSLEDALKSGKVVVLNFWGVRCSACIEELGYLNPMSASYREKGVLFLGVNVDGVKGEALKPLIAKMENPPAFTVLPDPDFQVPDLYNLAGAPLSIVIGKNGKVVYRHEDFKPGDEKELEKALQKALSGDG